MSKEIIEEYLPGDNPEKTTPSSQASPERASGSLAVASEMETPASTHRIIYGPEVRFGNHDYRPYLSDGTF